MLFCLMGMRGLVFWFLLLVAGPAMAQESAVLRGRVLDAETGQPVPSAQVGVANNRIGTSTNADGAFVLVIPATYQHEALEVALLGYRKYAQVLPPLPGPELRIRLQISPAALGEVVVTSSVTGIVREAVARIPRNYPTRPTRLTGFYREADNVLSDSSQYQYFAEGLLTVRKAGYQHPGDDGDVQIQESRKLDLRAPPAADHGWYAGPFIPHRFDFVHRRTAFIDPAHFRDYDYHLMGQTAFRGRLVYVVVFAPKSGRADRADFAGQVYIAEDSYAFLRAEWHRTPAGIRREHLVGVVAEERAYRVDYQPYGGRWHLKSVWYRTKGRFLNGRGGLVRHLGEYLTTAIDTAQAPRPAYPVRAQFHDVFLENSVPYDSAFWQRQNVLVPPVTVQRALRAAVAVVPKTPPDAGPLTAAPPARRSRLRYGFGLGTLPLVVPGAVVQVGFAPAGSGFQALGSGALRAQGAAYWSSICYAYEVAKGLSVGLATRSVYPPLAGDGWEAGLAYEYNFNPRRRPVFIRVGLMYFRQTVARGLGPYHNPDAGLRVAGIRLKADELGLSLQTRTSALQPKLGLGVELSRRAELVADLGWLVGSRTRTQLALDERSGFWLSRSAAALDLPAAGAALLIDGEPAAIAPWEMGRLLLGVGLLYRLW